MRFSSATLIGAIFSALNDNSYGFGTYTPLLSGRSTKSFTPQRSSLVMKDYPKPNLEDTDNYRLYNALSASFKTSLKASPEQKKKVAIIGGGLSGLACAKYLVDAGHEPIVYEAR